MPTSIRKPGSRCGSGAESFGGGAFSSYADLKKSFNAVDKVAEFYVFDIGGNKYRLIAAIHFNRQILYVQEVFTHGEYDKWKP